MVKGLSWQALKQGDEQEFRVEELDAERWLTVRASAMDQGTDEATDAPPTQKVILIFRDTTAHKQAEQERESSRHMMALAEMATVLAHEIRNPLGSLELLTGLLASDSALSDDSRQWVQSLRAGVRSLSVTVNNVLHYYSLGSPKLTPLRLGEALKSSVEFVRPLAQQSGESSSGKSDPGRGRNRRRFGQPATGNSQSGVQCAAAHSERWQDHGFRKIGDAR